jgi:plasmid stabilization system protein ParE
MVHYKIVWHPSARKQLIHTLEYFSIRNKNDIYSKKLLKSIKETTAHLSNFPNLGKTTDFETVRELVHLDYSIFYVVNSKTIDIVHFWDNRRDRKTLEEELNKF